MDISVFIKLLNVYFYPISTVCLVYENKRLTDILSELGVCFMKFILLLSYVPDRQDRPYRKIQS